MRRLALALALWPAAAPAHEFTSADGLYHWAVEGAAAPLGSAPVLLCLISLGVLAGTGLRPRVLAIWPWFVAGLVGGMALAALVPGTVVLGLFGVGAICALLAALTPRLPVLACQALAGIAAVLVGIEMLQGHAFGSLHPGIYAGIIFGAHLALLAPAAAASAALERWPAEWMRIGWRVVASWCGAVGLMLAAFTLR